MLRVTQFRASGKLFLSKAEMTLRWHRLIPARHAPDIRDFAAPAQLFGDPAAERIGRGTFSMGDERLPRWRIDMPQPIDGFQIIRMRGHLLDEHNLAAEWRTSPASRGCNRPCPRTRVSRATGGSRCSRYGLGRGNCRQEPAPFLLITWSRGGHDATTSAAAAVERAWGEHTEDT